MGHKNKETEKRHKRSRKSESDESDGGVDDKNSMRDKRSKEKRNSKHKRHRSRSSSSKSSESRHKHEHKKSRKSDKREEKKTKQKSEKYDESPNAEENDYGIEMFGYSNDNNPFGDSNLSEPLRWDKKLEQEGKADMDKEDIKKMLIRRRVGAREELEGIKKRKDQRDRERADRQLEMDQIQRDKESHFYKSWDEQDRIFQLKQAKEKTKIRFAEGYPNTIDVLAHYIYSQDDDVIADVTEPYHFLHGLERESLEDVIADLKTFKEIDLEVDGSKNEEYWNDMNVMANDELMMLMTSDPNCPYYTSTNSKENVLKEKVDELFKATSLEALIDHKAPIEEKLKGGVGIDAGHWSFMLERLKTHIATKRIDKKHKEILENKLAKLKHEQCINYSQPKAKETSSSKYENADIVDNDYDSMKYDPMLINPEDVPKDIILISLEEDLKRLDFARKNVLNTGQAQRDEEEEFLNLEREGMKEDEGDFNTEYQLRPETSVWSDKYRPRKPKYFNKVHTGFEWNKYNQTHYDHDNPPPKIVLGYKFNIFYPDLIDKTKLPTYKVTHCDENFSIIRFIAGPPYEDVAFKIVRREWDRHDKWRYKCEFHKNTLKLWFHFRKLRYRR